MTGTMAYAPATPSRAAAVPEPIVTQRIQALARFRAAAEPYLGPDRMQPVHTVAQHARQRLSFSPELTVAALAGPTGSGKSSIFNALTGRELSPVGMRRPTTSGPHAAVWGRLAEAAPLLDWLGVPPERRFTRDIARGAGGSAADGGTDHARLRGLILLDLPDFDSVERDHASEVERLLGLVDLVVWVVDPQKYADLVVHERYLRPFRRHRDVTVLVLNQADMVSPDDAVKLLEDLHRLLVADGLGGVGAMASSAVDLPAGLEQLRAYLTQAVAGQRAAWQRLAADVDAAVADLSDLVGPPVAPDAADRAAFGALADGLAEVAGVSAVAETVATSYRRRATDALDSPLLHPLVRRWVMPRLPALADSPPPAPVTSTGSRVAVRMAARTVAGRAADGLPAPWPEAIATASRAGLRQIPEALTAAVNAVAERGTERTPRWWRLISAGQWLIAGAAVFGAGWLVIGAVMWALSVPMAYPRLGPVPLPVLLVLGGVVAGGVVAALVQPLLQWASRRVRIRARQELRAAVAEVGRTQVVAPVREVLSAYSEARAALHEAGGV